ncbi:SDR family oxidoreductase [Desulfopila sp. IMCC35006]|uniref:SDR family oxidoreductase n=1 Tax=Desulfopila sp. IMCC35006 TaxID=2569542 RepID=UPI0010AC268D|nr:SDR family oxidoreductase [Desulfopila sp. IMCC35006]TKB26709.1 SDR family oxidoreductase [Desulfopila sp. IMCC35006]
MQKNKQRLSGQTCIVTGANSGIGEAVAVAIGRDGANVVINYVSNPEIAEDIAHKISKDCLCGEAIAIHCDVSQENQVEAMFQKAVNHFGTVDICVPNAGLQRDSPLHEMSLEDWNVVLDVNLTGQFLCAREAIREFLRRGMRPDVSRSLGKIIHMSSVHQIIPWAGHANYAASKGAIVMLMKSICQEYGPHKIRCNSIAPGAIKTPINRDAWKTPEALDELNRLIPYKRIGEPEDIGRVAVWLASDESEYINGTTIFVDGGMTCYPGFTSNG